MELKHNAEANESSSAPYSLLSVSVNDKNRRLIFFMKVGDEVL